MIAGAILGRGRALIDERGLGVEKSLALSLPPYTPYKEGEGTSINSQGFWLGGGSYFSAFFLSNYFAFVASPIVLASDTKSHFKGPGRETRLPPNPDH